MKKQAKKKRRPSKRANRKSPPAPGFQLPFPFARPRRRRRRRASEAVVGGRRQRRRVSHARRPMLNGRTPVHVSWHTQRDVPRLRTKAVLHEVSKSIRAANDRFGVRLVHFAVMRDHIHILVEPKSKAALSRAMNGLGVRLARAINRAVGRTKKVFDDRYAMRPMDNALQVRNAVAYVNNNARRHADQHGRVLARNWVDPFSSAPYFDGWKTRGPDPRSFAIGPPVTAEPRMRLLRVGWRRYGPIDVNEIPGRRTRKSRSPNPAASHTRSK